MCILVFKLSGFKAGVEASLFNNFLFLMIEGPFVFF